MGSTPPSRTCSAASCTSARTHATTATRASRSCYDFLGVLISGSIRRGGLELHSDAVMPTSWQRRLASQRSSARTPRRLKQGQRARCARVENTSGPCFAFSLGLKRLNSQRLKELDIYLFLKSDLELFQEGRLFQEGARVVALSSTGRREPR